MAEVLTRLIPAAERDSIVARHLQKHLLPLGLTSVDSRTWIDPARAPAKPVFELTLLKGAGDGFQFGAYLLEE
jgi:hypothetical protein